MALQLLPRRSWFPLLVVILGVLAVGSASEDEHDKKTPMKIKQTIKLFNDDELDRLEFQEFCELGLLERQVGKALHDDVMVSECSVTAAGEFDIDIDGKMLFTLIAIITYGAIIRAVIQHFDLQVPYTVVLMLSGLVVGSFSKKYCPEMNEYTAIARVSASLILYTFLPLLIFESAFSIPVHTFQRSSIQIIIVAFPGMVLCTFITSFVCRHYFTTYKWDFMQANLFGSIISATDPVAVVAILRELGVSEVLSVMIEGESLLNDGVAILLYEIFEEILEEAALGKTPGTLPAVFGHSVLKFVQIAIGGPAFGWAMGKITIFFLSYVFNDAPVEISVTIVTAYITYWLSEDVLGVSGVMAVVLLGLTMRAERTVISPDSEEAVHHFWSIMGYLANTVLFMLVGIVIAETAVNDIDQNDFWNLILLYIAIHVSRFVMLLVFYPILAWIGYGMTWQNTIVMMWGGLRGAVGVCLALDVYRNEHFCENKLMGSKMLFQTAGIVFLTLVVNGTTTRPLLTALRLTEVSVGRKEDMNNAIKRIVKLKNQAIRMFQLSPNMFDADWTMVNGFCTVKNPYKATKEPTLTTEDLEGIAVKIHSPEPARENATVCGTCHTVVPNEPTSEEYYNLTEEARLKVIRAMKVSYTHRNGIGLTSDAALQILMGNAERKEDDVMQLVCCSDFDKYTKNRGGFYPWLNRQISKLEKNESSRPPKPTAKWRRPFWIIVCQDWFEQVFLACVFLNLIPVIWELVEAAASTDEACGEHHGIFVGLNIAFTALFTVEIIINILGRRLQDYFCDPWTYLDIIVLLLAYGDCIFNLVGECKIVKGGASEYLQIVKVLRLLRVSRGLRLLRPILPQFQTSVSRKINEQLFMGFDIARGFVHSSEEVLKFVSQMIENKRVCKEIRDHMERERAEGLKVMAVLQQKYPGIAIALKTRHACRAVINVMCDTLNDAKDEGLLDDTEIDVLTRIMELKIKRLWHSPASIETTASQVLLANLLWVEHNEELYDTILNAAELKSYGFGQHICHFGDPTSGIYVVVAGMIKVVYMPTPALIEARNQYGKIPNSELYMDLTFSQPETDYFSSGFVFGEYGVLRDDPWASDIIAETSLLVYHIPKEVIIQAIERYEDPYDSLEGQLWRSVGMRRATGLLEQLPRYQNNLDKIQIVLQRSTIPINDSHNVFEIPDYVSEVVVIEGYATNQDTNDTYIAPFIVPRSCTKLIQLDNPATVNRILIIADEDVDLSTTGNEDRISLGGKNVNW